VALVDVLLPDDVTGLALVRSLQRPGCEVVAMSVRSGLRAAARAAGAVAFVEKGSDIDAILQAVRFAGSTS
jgi:DNA-binding NtrC family response regulator